MPAPPLRRRSSTAHRSHVVIGSLSTAVASAALLAAALVHLSDSGDAAAGAVPPQATVPAPAADADQFISQQGVIVAVSHDSVTARSADGVTRTYRLTPQTATITDRRTSSAPPGFAVDDEVAIVGAIQGDTAVATAVADRSMTGPDGPPMHFGDSHTLTDEALGNDLAGPVLVP